MGRTTKDKRVLRAKVVKDSDTRKGGFRKGLSSKYVPNRSVRGEGCKFPLEIYQKIASCKPGTLIKYVPNPKTKNSKSYARYQKYEKSKTIGESLKNGSKVADLLWEHQRGYLQLLGGERSEKAEIAAIGQKAYDKAVYTLNAFNGPRGVAFDVRDERAAKQHRLDEQWRTEKLQKCVRVAEELNLVPETVQQLEKLHIPEDRDLRFERRVCDAWCQRQMLKLDKEKRKATNKDVDEALSLWGFGQNAGRLNVLQKGQKYAYSDTLGCIRRLSRGIGVTEVTKRYPNFGRLLTRWLRDNEPEEVKGKFVCSAINLNANYGAVRHRDGNNEGPSVIRAFGKFKGGSLKYWPKDKKTKARRPSVETLKEKDCKTINIFKRTLVFDGTRSHEVEPFEGTRYSIVFFTCMGYGKCSKAETEAMKKWGFPWPTPQKMKDLKKFAFGATES
mmetsp:Transcript_60780/g.113643  ORF Transcript_60780/g.113643 Transcript_60780/m.113643 type:complete len:445 (-) Transcript_60780:309-1643(-)